MTKFLYIRGQKPRYLWNRWTFGRSVFRSERPKALAQGASFFLGYLFFLSALCGCTALKGLLPGSQESISAGTSSRIATYSGPKAKLTVADFDLRSAYANSETAAGLREMLITALTNSNRFSVAESQPSLIISIAITEFQPQASGGNTGVGSGGGAGSGTLGGLLGPPVSNAHLSLDLRVIDNATGKVLARTILQGQAADTTGINSAQSGSAGKLAGGLAVYANTPMEKAIRNSIIEAVRYISQVTPERYYK